MKVSWDDDIPNMWKHKKMFQTTTQITILDGKSWNIPIF
jgi:hypothetical protein